MDELLITKALGAAILPPAGNLLLMLTGALLLRLRRGPGIALLGLGWFSLLALSMPLVSGALQRGLESHPAIAPDGLVAEAAQAIVILAGGRHEGAPEYGGDTLSEESLRRVRYGAFVQRRTGLPVLVTGGVVRGEAVAEAALMGAVLEEEFAVPVAAVEDRSRTTFENARFTAELLGSLGIERVYLVTDASHMRRALAAFRKFGVEALPAPTAFVERSEELPGLFAWIPNARALRGSSRALYAYAGELWYRLRYGT